MWFTQTVMKIVCVNIQYIKTIDSYICYGVCIKYGQIFLCCYVVVFLCIETANLSSTPYGTCPAVTYSEFRVKVFSFSVVEYILSGNTLHEAGPSGRAV